MSSVAASRKAPPLSSRDRRMYRGAFWLFIIAETMIFVTLFAFRFIYFYGERPDGADFTIPLIVTVALALSVIPVVVGSRAINAGKPAGTTTGFIIGAVIALLVTALILYDWFTLPFSPETRFGSIYVMTTAYHALHIVIGAVALIAVGSSTARGRWSRENHWPVSGAALFWYFVVVMWIGVDIVLFLI